MAGQVLFSLVISWEQPFGTRHGARRSGDAVRHREVVGQARPVRLSTA